MRCVAAISAGPRSANPRGSRAFTVDLGVWSVMGLAGPARLKGTGPCHKRRDGPGQGGALVVAETSFPVSAAFFSRLALQPLCMQLANAAEGLIGGNGPLR